MTATARVALAGSAASQVSWPAGDAGDEAVSVFERLLDPAFLAEAGWDAGSRVLWPPPEHPLLGRPVCRAPGCQATAFGRARVCQRCQRRLIRARLGPDAVLSLPGAPVSAAVAVRGGGLPAAMEDIGGPVVPDPTCGSSVRC